MALHEASGRFGIGLVPGCIRLLLAIDHQCIESRVGLVESAMQFNPPKKLSFHSLFRKLDEDVHCYSLIALGDRTAVSMLLSVSSCP